MNNWTHLEQRFRANGGQLRTLWLDHQTGAAGEHWHLAGDGSLGVRREFEALAELAGARLERLYGAPELESLWRYTNPRERWYAAVMLLSGLAQPGFAGFQTGADAQANGAIMSSRVEDAAAASAAIAIRLESLEVVRGAGSMAAILGAPRYVGVADHYRKSREFQTEDHVDFENAVKEAVSAAEAMARLVSGDVSGTLGDAAKALHQSGRIPAPTRKLLEILWGYASNAEGVRHGSPGPTRLAPAEARFLLDVSDAALRFLVTLDTA